MTGSVALLGDTLHKLGDARRLTYGLGRTEDLAGLGIVLVIAASAAVAAWEAVNRLAHPRDVTNLG